MSKPVHEMLKLWRQAGGLTQLALGAKLGRSETYVNRKERGVRQVRPKEVVLWGRACEMPEEVIRRQVDLMTGLA